MKRIQITVLVNGDPWTDQTFDLSGPKPYRTALLSVVRELLWGLVHWPDDVWRDGGV